MLFSGEFFLGYLSHTLSEDPYVGLNVVELPPEVAKRITFEEQVTDININRLQ
jgi:DNA-directed RNA polymerase-5 subunit 1